LRYACSLTEGGLISNSAGPLGPVESRIVRDKSQSKTTYTLRFPRPSTVFGLGFLVNDGDIDLPGQQGWSGFHPYSIVFGGDLEKTALIVLRE
jgi:hypothetical protein